MSKQYLGDSVYADFDGFHVVLTTENGIGPSNIILIDDTVLAALFSYARSVKLLAQDRQDSEEIE